MKFLGESSRGTTGSSGAFSQWRDAMKRKQEEQRLTDPRYSAAQYTMTTKPSVTPVPPTADTIPDTVKSSPYLDEYLKARQLAEQRVKGQFESAQKEQDISRERTLAAQGGTSGGQALRLAGEDRARLESARSGAMNEAVTGVDIKQAEEQQRRKEFGQQLELSWKEMNLAERESVFNQMLALKESGIGAGSVEKMRPIFESMRVDTSGKQGLPPVKRIASSIHPYRYA